jgi:hypothetical protein
MGLVLTWREVETDVLAFDMTMRAGAPAIPMHVHPRHEERIIVVRGTAFVVSARPPDRGELADDPAALDQETIRTTEVEECESSSARRS